MWRGRLLAASLVIAACSSTPSAVQVAESDSEGPASGEQAVEEPDAVVDGSGRQSSIDADGEAGSDDDGPAESAGSPPDADDVEQILAELTEAGFCDPVDVEDEGVVSAMHFVVQGELQDPCYVDTPDDGEDVSDVVVDDDPRLLAAWDLLAEITPVELLSEISIIAGFEPCGDCNTLAFVTQLDEAGTFFIVAVDVVAAVRDPDELRLTMMHELTHVFGQAPGEQLVVGQGPDDCDTYYNGAGCFTDDSYLWAWMQDFWSPGLRATLPADGSVSSDEEAAERCDADAGYTGAYAATSPEEDFAETFSAYVFDVEVDDALDEKLAFFDRYPEFVTIRDNARAAGYSGTASDFDGCG